MLDFDLAELYEVQTKALNQAVKRNADRFPEDFMFQLSAEEWGAITNWSQFVTGTQKHRESKYLPYAFTEQGVAMLSSVLRSSKAVQTNIIIMRTFVMLRQYALTYDKLARKIGELEARYDDIHEVLNQLLMNHEQGRDWENRERIGFRKLGDGLR